MMSPPGDQPFLRASAWSAASGYETWTARKKSLRALRRVSR
jgi:hypothetical protein